MARRRSTRRETELSRQDVEAILKGAREFYAAVCRANVRLDFKSKAYMDNKPILNSLQIYCEMISGDRDVLREPSKAQSFPTSVRIGERKDTGLSGRFPVQTSQGALVVLFDDCPIRRGISPRFRRAEALYIAKLIARLLRDLEYLGDLPFASPDEYAQSLKVRPGWQRRSDQG
jgi:hypothetical protein